MLSQGAHFRVLVKLKWAPGPAEDQEEHMSGREVLSVSVVLTLSVESATECQMTCYPLTEYLHKINPGKKNCSCTS